MPSPGNAVIVYVPKFAAPFLSRMISSSCIIRACQHKNNLSCLLSQGFSKVVFSDRTARLRAVREEGAGCGLRPQPAPSSPPRAPKARAVRARIDFCEALFAFSGLLKSGFF